MRAPTDPGDTAPEILPFGQAGVLVRMARTPSDQAAAAAQACARALTGMNLAGVRDVATSLTSVLLEFDHGVTSRGALLDAIRPMLEGTDWNTLTAPAPNRLWRIPATFGGDHGPDLSRVAKTVGCTPSGAIDALVAPGLRVLSIGFAPGQPYIGFLGSDWALPRLSEITPHVPAGAIVTAVRQLVLFANPSPTGWQHVGQTAFRPFLLTRHEPVLLRAGDAIRFEPISASEHDTLAANDPDGLGGARCEALS